MIFVQVPLVPSNFWATSLKICLQWLLISPHISLQPGFLWHMTSLQAWVHPHLPIVLLHQDFISIFNQVLLLCHTIAFPTDLYKNRKLILPDVFSKACAYKKDRVLLNSDSLGLACKGWARDNSTCRNFCSLLHTLHASPPFITNICCWTAIKLKCELR